MGAFLIAGKVIVVGALLSDNFVSFGKTDILETLTYKVEQWWTAFHESEEVLGLTSLMIGCNMSGNIQMAMLYTKHMAFLKGTEESNKVDLYFLRLIFIFFDPPSQEILSRWGYGKSFSTNLSGMPSAP